MLPANTFVWLSCSIYLFIYIYIPSFPPPPVLLQGVEVSVDALLESKTQREAEVKRVTAAIEQETNKGKDVVIYTTRQVGKSSLYPSLEPSPPHLLIFLPFSLRPRL